MDSIEVTTTAPGATSTALVTTTSTAGAGIVSRPSRVPFCPAGTGVRGATTNSGWCWSKRRNLNQNGISFMKYMHVHIFSPRKSHLSMGLSKGMSQNGNWMEIMITYHWIPECPFSDKPKWRMQNESAWLPICIICIMLGRVQMLMVMKYGKHDVPLMSMSGEVSPMGFGDGRVRLLG